MHTFYVLQLYDPACTRCPWQDIEEVDRYPLAHFTLQLARNLHPDERLRLVKRIVMDEVLF